MAKDVDLSSKEWCDIVFDHKNKDFGAYTMRQKSDGRHNKSMIVVVIFIIVVFVLAQVVQTIQQRWEEAQPKDQIEQIVTTVENAVEEEEEVEEEKFEQPEPEALPEEILNTVKVTELLIAKDEEVTKDDEIKSADELKETETAFGNVNFDQGTDDRNVVREHKNEVIVEEKSEPVEEKVFTAVEQMPRFPGGDEALMKYLSSHINYPTMAMENNVQGRVVVQFVVTKTGKIGEVKVVRSVDRDLDREAVRVCKTLPDFIPGKMNGQAVAVWYTLPVSFKLQGVN